MSILKFKYHYDGDYYNTSSNIVPKEKIIAIEKEFNDLYKNCIDLINEAGGFIQVKILDNFSYDKEMTFLTGIIPPYPKVLEECLHNKIEKTI